MRTRKPSGAPPTDSWKKAFNDAVCEFEFSVRQEKVDIARKLVLDEIENALHGDYTHPQNNELKIALNVIDALIASPHHKKSRAA